MGQNVWDISLTVGGGGGGARVKMSKQLGLSINFLNGSREWSYFER